MTEPRPSSPALRRETDFSVRPLARADCRRIAEIHVSARPGDVLPDLGVAFLDTLYGRLLGRPGVWAFVGESSGRVVGFVLGCADTGATMRAVAIGGCLPLAWHTLAGCARRPRLAWHALETLRYPARRHAPGPELMVVAVEPDWQGCGVGSRLIATFSERLRLQGCSTYHVAVKSKNDTAARFYGRLGFRVVQRLAMYGEPWDLYEYRLTSHQPSVRPAVGVSP